MNVKLNVKYVYIYYAIPFRLQASELIIFAAYFTLPVSWNHSFGS